MDRLRGESVGQVSGSRRCLSPRQVPTVTVCREEVAVCGCGCLGGCDDGKFGLGLNVLKMGIVKLMACWSGREKSRTCGDGTESF